MVVNRYPMEKWKDKVEEIEDMTINRCDLEAMQITDQDQGSMDMVDEMVIIWIMMVMQRMKKKLSFGMFMRGFSCCISLCNISGSLCSASTMLFHEVRSGNVPVSCMSLVATDKFCS